MGISLIVWSLILQAVFSFVTIQSCCKFVISVLTYIIITLILLITLHAWNERFAKKYYEDHGVKNLLAFEKLEDNADSQKHSR